MAVKEITLYEYVCDADYCKVQTRVAHATQLPNGWRTGTVEDSDGEPQNWHSCSPSHVEDAVEATYSWRDNV